MNNLDQQLLDMNRVRFEDGFTERVMNRIPSGHAIIANWRPLLLAYAASILLCVLLVYQTGTGLDTPNWLGTDQLDEEELVEASALGLETPTQTWEQ